MPDMSASCRGHDFSDFTFTPYVWESPRTAMSADSGTPGFLNPFSSISGRDGSILRPSLSSIDLAVFRRIYEEGRKDSQPYLEKYQRKQYGAREDEYFLDFHRGRALAQA